LAGGVVGVDVGAVFVVADTVYGIIERPGQEKAFWSRIGVAFKYRDGSINREREFFPRGLRRVYRFDGRRRGRVDVR
jgi:hypothetical protein